MPGEVRALTSVPSPAERIGAVGPTVATGQAGSGAAGAGCWDIGRPGGSHTGPRAGSGGSMLGGAAPDGTVSGVSRAGISVAAGPPPQQTWHGPMEFGRLIIPSLSYFAVWKPDICLFHFLSYRVWNSSS